MLDNFVINMPDSTDTITVTGKPSTGQAGKYYEYKDYTKTWKNYCPFCGKSGTLSDTPKGLNNVPEHELTCDQTKGGCDADFDITTGADKSGQYRAYLVDANGKSNTKDSIDTSIGGGEAGGGPTTTETTGGAGAVQIPDQTFYGLIKQMIGAIDGMFIIANNMAFLLSFKQLYEYRNKYEDYIVEIKPSDILKDSVEKEWTTQGLYNTIELTYSGGIIQYQHDALVETYGQNIYYYDFPDDNEETAKAKAQSLLAAHIRDYSLDLYLKCLYNPNITPGCWVKIPKTYTKITGDISTAGYQRQQENKQNRKVRKGVNIENIVTAVQEMENQTKRTVQTITTEDNEKYDVEIDTKDYEVYFVQGYKLRWTPNQSPTMHLHLKYGPDTPEDPVVATISVGGVQSAAGGGFGDDCFWIGEIMPNNNAKIGPHGPNAPDLHRAGFEPQEQHYRPRCKAGSNLANDMAGKTPQEVHNAVRSKFGYCRYAESTTLYPCVSDMYDQACGTNCGDGARILKCALDAINVKSWGVHVDGHYFVAADINGEWVCLDATGRYSWSNTAGWAAGPKPANCCEPGQASSVRAF